MNLSGASEATITLVREPHKELSFVLFDGDNKALTRMQVKGCDLKTCITELKLSDGVSVEGNALEFHEKTHAGNALRN